VCVSGEGPLEHIFHLLRDRARARASFEFSKNARGPLSYVENCPYMLIKLFKST